MANRRDSDGSESETEDTGLELEEAELRRRVAPRARSEGRVRTGSSAPTPPTAAPNPATAAPGAAKLGAPAAGAPGASLPSPGDTIVPPTTEPEFVEEISSDLLLDAAESLRMIRVQVDHDLENVGISLADLGLRSRHTTQKILLRKLPKNEDDEDVTVIERDDSHDLTDSLDLTDDDEGATEEIPAELLKKLDAEHKTFEDETDDVDTIPPIEVEDD